MSIFISFHIPNMNTLIDTLIGDLRRIWEGIEKEEDSRQKALSELEDKIENDVRKMEEEIRNLKYKVSKHSQD